MKKVRAVAVCGFILLLCLAVIGCTDWADSLSVSSDDQEQDAEASVSVSFDDQEQDEEAGVAASVSSDDQEQAEEAGEKEKRDERGTRSVVNSSAQKKTITSEGGVYRIEVPVGWEERDDKDKKHRVIYVINEEDVFLDIYVNYGAWGSLFDFNDSAISAYRRIEAYEDLVYPPDLVYAAPFNFERGRYPMILTEISFTYDSQKYIKYLFVLEVDSAYIRIIADCLESKKGANEQVIKEIAASFRVMK